MSQPSTTTAVSSHFANAPQWRQILFAIRQRHERRDDGAAAKAPAAATTRPPPAGLSILTCCVSSQSDIGRVRIDRSMIGRPSDFRHIGHMGANDLSGSYNETALNSLLRSKGDDEFRIPVPANFRAKDVPISGTIFRFLRDLLRRLTVIYHYFVFFGYCTKRLLQEHTVLAAYKYCI